MTKNSNIENIQKISIVIPVFNSCNILPELNRQIEDALNDILNYELILINDGSKDKSWETIIKLSNHNKKIIGLNLKKNYGQDSAILSGLIIAQGDYTVIMDDDLQHSPYDILRLVKKCQGFDVCYGKYIKKKDNKFKIFGSYINGIIAMIFGGKPRNIYLSPFKVISKNLRDKIIKQSYSSIIYIDRLILKSTRNISQIYIEHHTRYAGFTNYNFLRSTKVLLKHFIGYIFVSKKNNQFPHNIIKDTIGIELKQENEY
jgi:undecaprenyl-phosphate 4-deoxy-4-formamido-L-arabinose transferase